MLGCPEAVDHWSKVYDYLIKEHQLAEKVGLVGLSRGGLYCYNFAVAYLIGWPAFMETLPFVISRAGQEDSEKAPEVLTIGSWS